MEQLYKDNFYPNASIFYKILKANNIETSHKEVKDFIEQQSVYQVHKPIVKFKTKEKPIFVLAENEQLQLDILDYSKYKKSNRNYAWILIGIDIFTRKGYACALKNKSPDSVLNGFKTFQVKPLMILHDDGSEFKGEFKSYLQENDIENVIINSKYHTTLGVIDRFSKTLKNIIEKLFSSRNSVVWFKFLEKIIEKYNETPHNGIKQIAPDDVMEKENHDVVSNLNFWKAVKNNEVIDKKQKLNIGDYVRLQINKNNLTKGYTHTYSKKVYQVEEINGSNVKLNTDKVVNQNDLLVVPEGSQSIRGDKQEKANKKARARRKLILEGLD
jgi:hypothetical protein